MSLAAGAACATAQSSAHSPAPTPVPADSVGEPSHADCTEPILLTVGSEYIHEQPPSGPGKLQEFNGNDGLAHLFPTEINTVWYTFTPPLDGLIVFEVSPFRQLDDYDWMLFKVNDEAACDSISGYGIKPVRSNRARNDLGVESKTGLHPGYENLHAPPGPGMSYSKALSVKRGESYLLVLDNIYPGGKGHRISLGYTSPRSGPPVTVSGKIIDKLSGKPLMAEIFMEEDSTGYPLPALRNAAGDDTATADFSFSVPENTAVHLSALKKEYLLASVSFSTGSADTTVIIELEPASKGSRMVLFNIRFLPNKAEFQPNSFPELRRLLAFMQQSSTRQIRITGHTNTNVFASKTYLLDLSVYRAAAVRDFLTEHGIDKNRIRIAGAGGNHPLIESNNREEAMKNLRVEIELLN